jgi:hypothetical protein
MIMNQNPLTQAVAIVVQELTSFSSEDRHRIVAASMTLLGEAPARFIPEGEADEPRLGQGVQFPAKARNWVQQHRLTVEQINQVFHFGDEGPKIIAHIPGATRKEQVRNAYILCGIGRLLTNGETRFEDTIARGICESDGFFDSTNHMKYMKCSEFTGSREKGWVLTAPGMTLGALLVAQLSKGQGQ